MNSYAKTAAAVAAMIGCTTMANADAKTDVFTLILDPTVGNAIIDQSLQGALIDAMLADMRNRGLAFGDDIRLRGPRHVVEWNADLRTDRALLPGSLKDEFTDRLSFVPISDGSSRIMTTIQMTDVDCGGEGNAVVYILSDLASALDLSDGMAQLDAVPDVAWAGCDIVWVAPMTGSDATLGQIQAVEDLIAQMSEAFDGDGYDVLR
ncbi:hypothetical protein GLP59_17110 [Sulfitobacter sp. M220]|uniref:hypothetical protein n=1 Tax=Sulfitobacter sp. M220 TaxID=2675333 RepID=UPI001F4612D3|nr:hypothetical protein [Sulfitobacter sp. M220]MCF7779328.1 hypothetical protein [Sulfitobacter sp. M220]